MGIPAAVRAAADASDAAIAEFQRGVDVDHEPSALESLVPDVPEDEADQTSDSRPLEQPLDSTPPEDSSEGSDFEGEDLPDPTVFEQRYRTLEGKYRAEVPRLHQTISELKGQIQALQGVVSQGPMSRSADATEEPKLPAHLRHLKKEEADEYGEDILELQSRMARGVAEDVAEQKVDALTKRITQLEAQIARTSGQSLWDRVESKVPNARDINDTDPLWAEFLRGRDPLSGRTFREIGEEAILADDAERLVSLFGVYATISKSAGNGNGGGKPSAKPRRGSSTVSTKVKPKTNIRESDIKSFYNDVARGRYRGREDLRKRREAEIDAAMQEGRIRPG